RAADVGQGAGVPAAGRRAAHRRAQYVFHAAADRDRNGTQADHLRRMFGGSRLPGHVSHRQRGSLTTVPLILWALIAVIVISAAVAVYAVQVARARRELVLRLVGMLSAAAAPMPIPRG